MLPCRYLPACVVLMVLIAPPLLAVDEFSDRAAVLSAVRDHAKRGRILLAHKEAATILELQDSDSSSVVVEALDLITETGIALGSQDSVLLGFAYRAAELRKSPPFNDPAELVTSLSNLSQLLFQLGREERAREILSETTALADDLPDNSGVRAAFLLVLGNYYLNLGEFARGDSLFSAALRAQESRGDSQGVAKALNELGNSLRIQEQYRDALAVLERAVPLFVESYGPEHVETAIALNNLAVTLNSVARTREADSLFTVCVPLVVEGLGDTSVNALLIKCNAASIMGTRGGKVKQALEWLGTASPQLDGALGAEHPYSAYFRNNLAYLLGKAGEFGRAKALHERVLAGRWATAPRDTARIAESLDNLGSVEADLGDTTAAERDYREALSLRKAHLPEFHSATARSHLNLCILYNLQMDRQHDAEAECNAAGRILDAIGEDHPSERATLLHHRASIAIDKGEYDFAESLLVQYVRAAPDSLTVSYETTVSDLGTLRLRQKRPKEAIDHFKRSVGLTTLLVGHEGGDVADRLSYLATAYVAAGMRAEAVTTGLRAQHLLNNHVRRAIEPLSERGAFLYLTIRSQGLGATISALADRESSLAVDSVWTAVIQSRGIIFDELALRRSLPSDRTEELRPLYKARNEAAEEAAFLLTHGVDDGPQSGHEMALRSVFARVDSLEEELAKGSETFRHERNSAIANYSDCIDALTEDAGLVTFYKYKEIGEAGGTESYAALIASKAPGHSRLVKLGAAAPIEAAISEWLEAIAIEGSNNPPSDSEAKAHERGHRVRQLLWDPIASYLDVRTLYLVPDEATSYVHFQALPAREHGYLIEGKPHIVVLSREKDLLHGPQRKAGSGLLAIGGVDYNKAKKTGTSKGGFAGGGAVSEHAFDALQHSEKEAETACEAWKAKDDKYDGLTLGEVLRLSDDEATEARVKELAPGKLAIHFATHGFSVSVPPRLRKSSSTISIVRENPLYTTGLALAGVNRSGGQNGGDGILTAAELASLDLEGVSLAVLSACNSGRGPTSRSEGIFGLPRALQVAGVSTVVMSLSVVDDKVAKDWMKTFYQEWNGPGSEGNAATAASLKLLQKRRQSSRSEHPHYWSPFLVVERR